MVSEAAVLVTDDEMLSRLVEGVGDPVDAAGLEVRPILSMDPMSGEEYLNAAFLRSDDASEPVRLSDPDGALMIYTSEPGLKGTLMVARVDTAGAIRWNVDTGIDRFKLLQILPGKGSFAFVGTRPPVPDQLSEPVLVIVDNDTGESNTLSLWR